MTCIEAVTTNKITASQAEQMHEQHYESLESTQHMRRYEAFLENPQIADALIELIDEKLVAMTTRNCGKVLRLKLVIPYDNERKLLVDFDTYDEEPVDYFELPAVKTLMEDNGIDIHDYNMYWFVNRLFNGIMWNYIQKEYSGRGFNACWWTTEKPNDYKKSDGYAEYCIDYVHPTDAKREQLLNIVKEQAQTKKKSLFERLFGK